jgi:hypothetical protein
MMEGAKLLQRMNGLKLVCGDIKEVDISGKFDWIIDDGSHKGIDVLTGI